MRAANLDLGRSLPSIAGAAAVLALASCQLVGGFQSFQGGGGATATTGAAGGTVGGGGPGGSGGAPACAADGAHTCIPKLPMGWAGPVLLYEVPFGMDVPACVGAYNRSMGDFGEDLDEGTAKCSCECTVSNIQCTDPIQLCGKGNAGQCNNGASCAQVSVTPPACVPASLPTGVVDIKATNPAPTDMGSCDAPAFTMNITTPKWASEARACTGPAGVSDGCAAGDLCVPSPTMSGKLCIGASGSQACPNSFFSERHELFSGFHDGRGCTACSCLGPPTSTCDGSVAFFDSPDCSGNVDKAYVGGGCSAPPSGTPMSATYTPQPSGTCSPMGGQLTGQVVKKGALTVCCH
jgi:hypothetical protein